MEQVLHVLQESRRRMKAVITAGGEGTRLYPSSRAFPKELIHFCGIPVIEYGIKILKENNITDIYVVTGRKKGALQDYLGDGSLFGVNIAYVTQEEPKGLGDAVLCTRPHIEDSKDGELPQPKGIVASHFNEYLSDSQMGLKRPAVA